MSTDPAYALAADHNSSASALAERAAQLLLESLASSADHAALEALGLSLIRAQPAMAPIARLVSAALRGMDAGGPGAARRAVRRQQSETRAAAGKLATAGADHVQPFVKILTHSASIAVREVLVTARARGVRFSVTCLESRPVGEGVAQARILAEAGIPVTLAVDAAMGIMVGESDAIMLGADTVSPTGLVHKIGTWPLCLAASELGVAVFVIATPVKLLPGLVRGALEQERDPMEVLPEAPASLKIANRAFDFTPLDLIDGLFVGGDLLDPDEVAQRANRIRLHPSVKALLTAAP